MIFLIYFNIPDIHNQMDLFNIRDQLYQIACDLNFGDLKNLCQSNRLSRQLFQQDRFQTLIQQKYQTTPRAIIHNIIATVNFTPEPPDDKKFGSRQAFGFIIRSTYQYEHKVAIIKSYNASFHIDQLSIRESLINRSYSQSILYNLLKHKLKFKGIEHLSPDEYSDMVKKAIGRYIPKVDNDLVLLKYLAKQASEERTYRHGTLPLPTTYKIYDLSDKLQIEVDQLGVEDFKWVTHFMLQKYSNMQIES